MRKHTAFTFGLGCAAGLCAALVAGSVTNRRAFAEEIAPTAKIYELRTYVTPPGGLENLNKRFREHTLALFKKHGMTNVGFWTPVDGPDAENTLIYILAHESRAAAKKSWAAFGADPEWAKARKESEAVAGGSLTVKVESRFLTPTDYSALK